MENSITYQFNDIYERDMDMLFVEELSCSKEFLSLFTNIIGLHNINILSIELSKTDIALGESDITVIIESTGKRIALLIEDKIDAAAMPQQADRYFLRGQKGIECGDYESFFVFIIAPEKYLSQNAEAQKYPNKISYETILKYFEELHDKRSDFKIQQLTKAIEKQKTGYQVVEDTAVTNFWNRYYKYQKADYPELYFTYNGTIKGPSASWMRFKTAIKGLFIWHKTKFGFIDLTFDDCSEKITDIEKILSDAIGDYTKNGFTINQTGKSVAIRLIVPVFDIHKQFDEQLEKVDVCLSAVRKMSDIAKLLNRNDVQKLLNKKD